MNLEPEILNQKKKFKLHNPFKPRVINEKLLREHLALERTKLANERTLLSYIRSSLYLLIGGIALLQIEDYGNLHWLGYAALCLCLLFIIIGFSRYVALEKKLKNLLLPDEEEETGDRANEDNEIE
ncbi:MAG TPA: DUF202 domain-containing protein [Flavobacteriaceae bacterium]|nr:DUF202 domain-containing protein [Flavobacteriaceae bacterium]